MIEQYRLIASKVGLNEYGNDISYKSFWDEHNKIDTYFTITTYDIIQGEGFKYKIIIELFREDKNKLEGLREKFKEHKQYDSEKEGEKTTNHIHFLVKEYDTSIDNLNRFADDVVGHIKKDFANLYVEMVEHLYPEKDISSWKQSMLSNSID
jgi:hydroxylamine reductase (hybrid-cluster protein)